MTPIPDPRTEPTCDVPRGGALLGLGKTASYAAARRYLETNGAEGLPVLKLGGRTLRCPTARLLQMLGVAAPNGDGVAHDEPAPLRE